LGNFLGIEPGDKRQVGGEGGKALSFSFDDIVNIRNDGRGGVFAKKLDLQELGELLQKGDQRMQGAVGTLSFSDPSATVSQLEDIQRNTVLQVWAFEVKNGTWFADKGHAVVAMESPEWDTKGLSIRSFGSNFPVDDSGGSVRSQPLTKGSKINLREGTTASITELTTYLTKRADVFVGQVPTNLEDGKYTVVFRYNIPERAHP
jgi:hypothetical protein